MQNDYDPKPCAQNTLLAPFACWKACLDGAAMQTRHGILVLASFARCENCLDEAAMGQQVIFTCVWLLSNK